MYLYVVYIKYTCMVIKIVNISSYMSQLAALSRVEYFIYFKCTTKTNSQVLSTCSKLLAKFRHLRAVLL